jgi:serine protease Do
MKRRTTVGIGAIALALASALQAQTAAARSPRSRLLADYSAAMEDLAKIARPAVVQIRVRTLAPLDSDESERTGFVAEQEASGSGVIVDPEGYIVTNAHVVENARRIEVRIARTDEKSAGPHGHVAPAKLVGLDRQVDIAVLKIEGHGFPALSFLNSDELRQGQLVLAIGSPLGLRNSLTHGVVSAARRQLDPDSPMVYVQTDAPINRGNSGGPLLDIEGRIAGINTMIMSQSGGSEGIGFAIPANLARDVYLKLRKDGRVRRGAIGVIPETITPALGAALGLNRDSGVILSDVEPRGAAEAAGLEQGDVVLAIDGKPAREARDLVLAVFQATPGDELRLDIQHNGQPMTKRVAVLDRQNEPSRLEELASNDAALIQRLGILAVTVDAKVHAIMPELRRLSGVAVAAVPAEYAGPNPGLVAGDVIYSFNKQRVESLDDLRNALKQGKSGDPIVFLVERSHRLIYVTGSLE